MGKSLRSLIRDDCISLGVSGEKVVPHKALALVIADAYAMECARAKACFRHDILPGPSALCAEIEGIMNYIAHYVQHDDRSAKGIRVLQFLVEGGRRIGRGAGVHFFAIHAQVMDGECHLFIVDHFKGHNKGFKEKLEQSAAEKKIKLTVFIAGGEKLQKDKVSCLFFSLAALRTLRKHPNIFDDLKRESNRENEVNWLNLPAELVWTAQSFSFLLGYIDYHMAQRATKELALSFNPAAGLRINEEGKVINDAISDEWRTFTGAVIPFLDEHYPEEVQLEKLLYKRHFPHVHQVLEGIVSDKPMESHPLIEYIYHHAETLEVLLAENKKLTTILCDANIQKLLALGAMQPEELFTSCISSGEANRRNIDVIERNLSILPALISILSLSRDQAMLVLMHSKAPKLFAEETGVIALVRKGYLLIEDALAIISFKIQKEKLAQCLTRFDKLTYLLSEEVSPRLSAHRRERYTFSGLSKLGFFSQREVVSYCYTGVPADTDQATISCKGLPPAI